MFVTVANMNPGIKLIGLQRLIDAVTISGQATRLSLVVAGAGIELEPLKRGGRPKGLANCVTFIGYLNRGKLGDLYQTADAFVQVVD